MTREKEKELALIYLEEHHKRMLRILDLHIEDARESKLVQECLQSLKEYIEIDYLKLENAILKAK